MQDIRVMGVVTLVSMLAACSPYSYTAIGDTVNTAAPIERLTADLGESLLVSADVLVAPPAPEKDLALALLSTPLLRGRSQPVQNYRPDWNAKSMSRPEPDEAAQATSPSTAAR
jgi:class 3 adenylate cyclase